MDHDLGPGIDGHRLIDWHRAWSDAVDAFLHRIGRIGPAPGTTHARGPG
jgi:hypothetical protein